MVPDPVGSGKFVHYKKLDRILPLSEARRVHELSEAGKVRGKIVLRVKDAQPSAQNPCND